MPHPVKERQPENRWSPEEDKILITAIERCGPVIVWSQVSACLPGRNSKSCRKRWIHSLDPTLRKGRWTEEEDSLLIAAVETYGTHWFQVARTLPGRTDDQCAKRWRENLDPSISRKPWTEKDDQLLMAIYEKIGKRWKDIASHFEGRPPVHCRNRVQSLVRARRRAAAAARKAIQAKLRAKRPIAEKKATIDESILRSSDPSNRKQKIPSFLEEGPASSGTPGNFHPPTPSPHASELCQDVRPKYPVPIPTHSVQPVAPASSSAYHPFVVACPSGSYPPYQEYDSRSTSASPPSWGTPHPQLSSHVPAVPHVSPPLYDPGPTSRWSALWSPFGSQLLDNGVGMQTPVPSVSHSLPNAFWRTQENTYKYSGDFCQRAHHSQVSDSTSLNCPTYYAARGPGEPELPMYFPSLLPIDVIPL